jgi:cholesterol transport system auxiliary component
MKRTNEQRRHLLRLAAVLPLLTVAGCQLPGQSPPPRTFRLSPKTTHGELPVVDWSLAVDRPSVDVSIDTNRIAQFRGVEIEFYADAAWIDRPAAMIQPLIIRSFLSSEAIPVVTDRRADLRTDFMLQTDIQGFNALPTDDGPPEARVVMDARLLTMPRRDVVGTIEIASTVPAAAGDLQALVTAFDDALGKVLKELVRWTLITGEEARGQS